MRYVIALILSAAIGVIVVIAYLHAEFLRLVGPAWYQ